MSVYPSNNRLALALERLASSRAKPVLSDYLACMRALTIAGDGDPAGAVIPTGQNDQPFQSGIDSVALISVDGDHSKWAGEPFLFVFDDVRRFRGPRHRSNGTADTANRWQTKSNSPLLLEGSPRKLSLGASATVEGLLDRVMKSSESFPLPRADDFAFWFYRDTDLLDRFGSECPSGADLVTALQADLGIRDDLWMALFNADGYETSATDFAPERPDPSLYIANAPTLLPVRSGHSDSMGTDVAAIHRYVSARGFTIEPWQVAAFITAVRTKPFVILAGISGTGKTKLPRLVAEATGSSYDLLPVRPDWTDSAELLGYRNLADKFRPGGLLKCAKRAGDEPSVQHFLMLDEMNIARVEYYLAEVLSFLEEKERHPDGSISSKPLLPDSEDGWNEVALTANLCVVGSVNMDETTHGFSRKVLDRAFVLEFSDVNLSDLGVVGADLPPITHWDARSWEQEYLGLAEYPDRTSPTLETSIATLTQVNEHLRKVQLQVGFRVRDEVALFVLNAQDCIDAFVTRDDVEVDPLDLAISMKVLPRIQGGTAGLREVLVSLLEWARGEGATKQKFPMCETRLELMLRRLDESGFTSFWL